jgi:hypothetical protein
MSASPHASSAAATPRPSRGWRARAAAILAALTAASGTAGAQTPAAAWPDPLGVYVRAALQENLGLRQARLDADRSAVAVREAVGLYLPTLALDTRRSRLDGTVNLGDFVNPASRALNQLTNSAAFPTDVNASLPFAQETHLRLQQPIYAPRVRANHAARRALRDLQDAAAAGAARRLAADVQQGYLGYASAAARPRCRRAPWPWSRSSCAWPSVGWPRAR